MSRSLMRHTIAELEQLFDALKTDPKTLKALEEELQHWQTPRAAALLAKVQGTLKILNGVKSGSSSNTVPEPTIVSVPGTKDLNQQPDLWGTQSTSVRQVAPQPVVAQQEVIRLGNHSGQPSLEASAPAGDAGNGTNDTRGISIYEAYKILKATSCSAWEAIEQTRRQVVQQAHPEKVAMLNSEQRVRVQAEATRANKAYAVLRQFRTSTSDDI
jgi:hypothetical protein